jgi:xanthine dehydrogenase accessory factor
VAFCEAVYQGSQTVEDLTCHLARSLDQARELLNEGKLTVLVDPAGEAIRELKPLAVVDAILAKKNLGTSRELAPITVALGPGFTAGVDVDAVVETKRGHHLGRVLWTGTAAPTPASPASSAATEKSGSSTVPPGASCAMSGRSPTPSKRARSSLWWKRKMAQSPWRRLWTASSGA